MTIVSEPVAIKSLSSGVPGLDTILGGGIPEFSFNLIAGGPGAGKTTLAQQIIFANATVERPALYFTVLGEPTIKMLRYQRQFSFFDPSLVGTALQLINLSEEALEQNLVGVLDRIVAEVERARPGIIVVDSFRTISGRFQGPGNAASMALDHFIQRLALHLTTWEVTSLLIGEYEAQEQRNPVFTVADGIFWLSQETDRNSVVRKMQVIKTRGRAPMPGLHTFRVTDDGLQVFPRIPEHQQARTRKRKVPARLSTGVVGLDNLMHGGIVAGDAVMLTGPAGSGKSTIATQFVAEGLRHGENAVIAVFEEHPEEYLARVAAREPVMKKMLDSGNLRIIYLRPLDLSVDEALSEIVKAVTEVGADRVVIDSLAGFEVALAPTFRQDFRESLYRLVSALTSTGVTVLMTAEVGGNINDTGFTSGNVSFISDEIIVQRYIEIEGALRRVIAVIKMRGSEHSHEFRSYEITAKGVEVGDKVTGYSGITSGILTVEPQVKKPARKS